METGAASAAGSPMILLTHLLVVCAYALGAVFVALMLPQAVPGIGANEAAVTAALVFLAAALLHEVFSRRGGERELGGAAIAAHRAAQETASSLDAAQREIGRLRQDLKLVEEGTKRRLDSELVVVKTLLGQLADHIEGRRPAAQRRAAPPPAAVPLPTAVPPAPAATPVSALAEADLVGAVREAIEGNRVDLYLQPIVSLPQRKVRFYEALSRLRDGAGRTLTPDRYLGIAEETGLITTIDNLLLFRCVQLLRKLKRRSKMIGFFCNLSPHTLKDEAFFAQFSDFLAAQPDLADHLVFEIAAAELRRADPATTAKLARLGEMGFGLSLDQVPGLDLDFTGLARLGFHYVKIEAARLLSARAQAGADIAVGDLKQALFRHGIDLIAEKVEAEPAVVDLLELEVDFGQGYLFGEPKLARGEG
jgi:cyclic-di-GMP phosphodiesterase TipF (flagellum assembly factor)